MSFQIKALSFAEGLVDYVLEHYSKVHYKPVLPDYRLNRKSRTSSFFVDSADQMFRPIVGRAAVLLQPYFEVRLNEIDFAVHEQVPKFFEPVKFLGFCSLVTLEMARDYFVKGNHSIPESTTLFICKLLNTYHQNGSFLDDQPLWEGIASSSWAAIYETARSLMNFRLVLLKSSEFVPEVSPPTTPEPVLPSAFVHQCHHPPSTPLAQLYYKPFYQVNYV